MAGTQVVTLVVDGAYSAKDQVGGWAAILSKGDRKLTMWGYESPSTNNRMELMAAIMGFRELRPGANFPGVEVVSDSEYVIKGITDWIYGWMRGGWINTSQEPVKNKELWQELHALVAPYGDLITWTHTRGHLLEKAGRESLDDQARYLAELNREADLLAVQARLLGAGHESSLDEGGRTLVGPSANESRQGYPGR